MASSPKTAKPSGRNRTPPRIAETPLATEALEAAVAGAEEASELVVETVERSVDESRAAIDRLKSATDEAAGLLSSSLSVASNGLAQMSVAAIKACQVQADAQLEFMKDMMAVRSLSDAVALQTSFLHQQLERMRTQGEDFSATARRFTEDTSAPVRDHMAAAARA